MAAIPIAVWDDKGQVGRYVFVIGDREIPGGDLAFPSEDEELLDPGQSIHRARSRQCSGRPDKWADGGQRPSGHAWFRYSIVVNRHCDNGLFLGKIELG